jgi:hypothetical protein
MKKLLVVALLTVTSAFAETVSISCEMPEMVPQHRFSLEAEVEINNDKFEKGVFSILFQDPGYNGENFVETLQTSGDVKVFPAGTFAVNDVYHLQAVQKGSFIEHVSLLLDFAAPLSSKIRLYDGRTYKATCSINK